MAQLKACHISELPDDKGLSIFIPRSKTDIFREGSVTYISDTHNCYSPVVILKQFMSRCGIELGQNVFIFTALTYHPSIKAHKPLLNKTS